MKAVIMKEYEKSTKIRMSQLWIPLEGEPKTTTWCSLCMIRKQKNSRHASEKTTTSRAEYIDFPFAPKLIEIVWNVSFAWNPLVQTNILPRIRKYHFEYKLNKLWLSPSNTVNIPFSQKPIVYISIYVDSKFINHWIGDIKRITFSMYIWTFEPVCGSPQNVPQMRLICH